MKKTLTVLCALLCMAGVMFAGGRKDTAKKGDDLSQHVVIKYMTTGDKPTNGATEKMLEKLNAILTEKVNAELEIYYIEWTDYMTKYNLTLAQMDGTVDLVGTATDWLDAWPNSKNGAFMALSEDMLKKYAPKTWESVSQEHWDMCKYDGDIYFMPEDNYAQWTNHGFMYRGDWAKEAGLADGVHSWDQLTAYLKWVKANKPGVIPWDSDAAKSLQNQMSFGYIASHTPYVQLDGVGVDLFGGSRKDLYKIYSPYYTGNELVEFAKLMKDWDSAGIWKTDVLNNSSSNRDEFYLGQTACDQHHTETWYGTVRPRMEEDQPGSDVGFFWFGEEIGNVTGLSISHGAMALSAASKNPERALMVYDLLRNDPECYNLFNYGIEGVQYEVLPNGTRQKPASYDNDLDAITTNYWWGRNDDLEIRDSQRAWAQYDEIVKAYDAAKIDYPYGQLVLEIDSIRSEIDNMNDVFANYMPRICYGKFDNAEAIVKEFRAALKAAGIENVIAEIQRQIDTVYR